MKNLRQLLLLLLLLTSQFFCGCTKADTTVNFTLPAAYTTSAGVYKTDGTLVRTLWRKVAYAAGTHTVTWDDKDDSGAVVPAATYQVRVLYHNVNYVWEGTIGNTASSFTGYIRRGYQQMADMTSDGTNVFSALGYNENQPGLQRFVTGDAQTLSYSNPKCITTSLDYVATDGTRYYVANTGGISFGLNKSFVTAYNVSNNAQANFTNGTSICQQYNGSTCYPEHYFSNVIDKEATTAAASGLAVQKTGNILAVAHKTLNAVRLYDKLSGSLLDTISVTAPKRISFAPNGDLWVITGTSVVRYASIGGVWSVATTLSGLVAPLDVDVHPTNDNIVMVADGDTSQQVKAFDSTGMALWTFGAAGGYTTPEVSNNKLAFLTNKTFITILSDGSFWVADGRNDRVLHLSASRAYIEQIMYLPADYVATSDPNNPSRVIGHNWLEFEVDYSKPLQPGDPTAAGGNNCWKLVKNWGINAVAPYQGAETSEGINTVVTLSNGRTYAFVRNYTANTSDVFELPATGNWRFTGVTFGLKASLYANGDIREYTVSGGTQTVTQRTLTGFDTSNNPIWSAATTLASAPSGNGNPSYRGAFTGPSAPRYPVTSSNVVVSFDQSVGTGANTGMHLGGMNVGGTAWLWKASPAVNGIDYRIPAQQEGSFDIGNGVQYGGNMVHAIGRNIVYGYHGEGWKAGQANQFMHFWDDGLFVGQFGVPNSPSIRDARIGISGNAFSPSLVQVGGVTYFWVNDESNHNGVHRWKLDGLSSIKEMVANTPLGGTANLAAGTGLKAQYYNDASLSTLIKTQTDPTINFNWVSSSPGSSIGSDNFSVRWTGTVQPKYSETYTFTTSTDDGVKLWVNNQLLVNRWWAQSALPWSGSIALQAAEQYDIKMEYFEGSGVASAKLEWQSPSQAKEVVPQLALFPAS